jgi:hypothetical protein
MQKLQGSSLQLHPSGTVPSSMMQVARDLHTKKNPAQS